MKLAAYFRSPQIERALERYAEFTEEKRWSLDHKFDLYTKAKMAFGSGLPKAVTLEERQAAFRSIYDSLRAYWQVFRNGQTYWDAETTFQSLRTKCKACSRDSGLTLLSLSESNLQSVTPCLMLVKDMKKLRAGGPPVMTFSKFLHFFNPKLFPVYDNAYIRSRVIVAFRRDWRNFCSGANVDPESEGVDLYVNYMSWAADLLRSAGPRLSHTFGSWCSIHLGSHDDPMGVLNELKEYYAAAFEFIAIGAALLEEDKEAMPRPAKYFGDYIVSDPGICHGKLTFVGTRVLVADVLEMVSENAAWEGIVRQYHGGITKEAIAEAVSLSARALLDHAEDYVAAPMPA